MLFVRINLLDFFEVNLSKNVLSFPYLAIFLWPFAQKKSFGFS